MYFVTMLLKVYQYRNFPLAWSYLRSSLEIYIQWRKLGGVVFSSEYRIPSRDFQGYPSRRLSNAKRRFLIPYTAVSSHYLFFHSKENFKHSKIIVNKMERRMTFSRNYMFPSPFQCLISTHLEEKEKKIDDNYICLIASYWKFWFLETRLS